MCTGCVAPSVRWLLWPWSLRKCTSGQLRRGSERQDLTRCCSFPLGQVVHLCSGVRRESWWRTGGWHPPVAGQGGRHPCVTSSVTATQEKEIINLQGALIGINESYFPYYMIPILLTSKLMIKVNLATLTQLKHGELRLKLRSV